MTAVLFTGCKKDTFEVKKIDEYFYEVGTYTSLDYDYANKYFAESNDNWGGGCSAVSAVIGGERLIGRNMDLDISNKCAYVVRTDVPGKYETFGLAYTFRDVSPDKEKLEKEGLGEKFEKVLPFMCDDVINSEGLHIEIDMRNNEKDADGNDIFGVEHTNEDAPLRVYVFNLTQYIALNCKDVAAAKKYIAEEVDVYSKKDYWNYSFVISDASGNSALLEFGNRKYYWTNTDKNGVVAQTNFYVNKECNDIEDNKAGLGRYETLINEIGSVKNESQLFELMKKVSYSWFYTGYDNCKENHFDPRSEIIGDANEVYEYFTFDVVMNPEIEPYVKFVLDEQSKEVSALTRKQKMDDCAYWESTFTEVVNPAKKNIKVRLFENDSMLYDVSFDGVKKIDKI